VQNPAFNPARLQQFADSVVGDFFCYACPVVRSLSPVVSSEINLAFIGL
jgi:hypothetical protein